MSDNLLYGGNRYIPVYQPASTRMTSYMCRYFFSDSYLTAYTLNNLVVVSVASCSEKCFKVLNMPMI